MSLKTRVVILPLIVAFAFLLTLYKLFAISGYVATGFRIRLKSSDETITIGVAACGEKSLDLALISLKSAILSSIHHGIESLDAIIFTNETSLADLKVGRLKVETRGLNFRYEIHSSSFPTNDKVEWESLFRPCAAQRLFLPETLPHIDKILYLDTDTLVIGDISEVWKTFRVMSNRQVVGIAAENEEPSHGWYNNNATHPFYPPLGLNSGVMLMNLARLREDNNLRWNESILSAYQGYNEKIRWGDQDLINIVFHFHPDAVYLFPCSYNYRTDHCEFGWSCESAETGSGIIIMHGNRHVFQEESHLFYKVYTYFEKFNMTRDDYMKDIILPLRREFNGIMPKNITNLNCTDIGPMLFKF